MFTYSYILLVLSLVSTVGAFDLAANVSHFIKDDTVKFTPFTADLVMELDLHEVHAQLQSSCASIGHLRGNMSASSAFWAHMTLLCDSQLKTWDSMTDLVDGDGIRRPRFLLTTIFSSLVAGISGYIFGSSHSSSRSDEMLLANQQHMVHVLRDQEHRGAINGEHIATLARILEHDQAKFSVVEACLLQLAVFVVQSRDLQRLSLGVERLVLSRHLSPELISSDIISDKLSLLSQQALKQKKVLAITNEIDVFKCPVSFGTYQNLTLRVVVHVPAMNALDTFSSFDYLPVPFPVDRDFYQILPFDYQLLVRSDRKFHSFLTVQDRRMCTTFSNFVACPQFTAQRSALFPSCLWALFSGDSSMTRRTCTVHQAPFSPDFFKLSDGSFIIYHSRNLLLRLECASGVTSELFSGIRHVHVPSLCHAHNEFFTLGSSSVVGRVRFHYQSEPVRLSTAELTLHPDFNASRDLSLMASQVHDPRVSPVLPFPSLHSTVNDALTIASLSVVITLLFVLILLWYLDKRRQANIIRE